VPRKDNVALGDYCPRAKKCPVFVPVILEAALVGDILERSAISSQPQADGRLTIFKESLTQGFVRYGQKGGEFFKEAELFY